MTHTLLLIICFVVVAMLAELAQSIRNPPWPSNNDHGRRHAFFQLLEDTQEPSETGDPNVTFSPNATNITFPPESPEHKLPLASDLLISMNSASAVVSLLSAVVNPALCTQSSRINLILSLSECNFEDLESIEPTKYPVQVGFGGDPAGKYFAALVLVWPFAGILIGIHYAIVKAKTNHEEEDAVEKSCRRLHFPSLSVTALVLFFWQPMAMSSVTVLARGKNQWMRFMCFGGLVAALAVSSFGVRWYWSNMKCTEFLGAADFQERLILEAEDEEKEKEEKEKKEREEAERRAREEEMLANPSTPVRKKSFAELRRLGREEKQAEAEPSPQSEVKTLTKTRSFSIHVPLGSTEVTEHGSCVEKTFTSAGRWVDKRIPGEKGFGEYPNKGFVDKYGYFYMKYRPKREWFFITEIVVCTVFGFIEGIRPLTLSGCWNLSLVYVCTLGIYVLMTCILFPYVTRWDNFSFGFLSLAQMLSMLFIVVDIKRTVSSNSGGDFFDYDSLKNFSVDFLRGNMTAEQSSDIRHAADFMAFVCYTVAVGKGLFDISVMYYFYRRRKAMEPKNDDPDDDDAQSKPAAAAAPRRSGRGRQNEEDDEAERIEIERPSRAARAARRKAPAIVDQEEVEEPLLSALSVPNLKEIARGKKGGKKQQAEAHSNPLAEEEEGGERAQQTRSQKPSKKERKAARRAQNEAQHEEDVEMPPAQASSSARKRGGAAEPAAAPARKPKKGRKGANTDDVNIDF